MKLRRVFWVIALSLLLIVTIPLTAMAASYPADYRYWSQGASSNTKMSNYGCWVVAQAKLIYEANIDRSSSFNPDTYMTWEQENGYLNSGFYQVNGANAPVAYANSKGKTLSYLGSTSSSVESKIWDNISKGYWTLIYVKTSSGSDHYVMIANELSRSNGKLYCYNSYVGYSSAAPSSVEARGYTLKSAYTYAASASPSSASSVSISHGYSGKSDSITDSNAFIYGTVSKASSDSASKFGIFIRRTDSTYDQGWSYIHNASQNWVGESKVQLSYDFKNEVGLTLTHATSYTYKLYAVINGKEYYSSEKTITTTGSHSYGSWKTVTNATCTAAGSKTRTCACGASETQSIAALEHSYASSYTVDKAPTCTAAGSKSKHCTRCSATTSVTAIPATGHTYGSWQTVTRATCTATGLKKHSCACGASETQSIAALGHSYASSYTVDKTPTCTAAGSKSKHCTRCSATASVTAVPATGHAYGAWMVTKESTASSTGLKVRKCTNSGCTAQESAVIDKLGASSHTHSFGSWITEVQVTCTTDGLQKRYCSVCQAYEAVTVPATGHSFGEMSIEKAATCTEEGIGSKQCRQCSLRETVSIPATGHSFGEWTVSAEPTDVTDGVLEHCCSVCSAVETQPVPMAGTEIPDDTHAADETEAEANVDTKIEASTDPTPVDDDIPSSGKEESKTDLITLLVVCVAVLSLFLIVIIVILALKLKSAYLRKE